MRKMNFDSYPFQSCMFTWRKDRNFAILLLYVDDILVATNSQSKMNEIKTKLASEFSMTNLGEPRKFLGMQIERDRTTKRMFIHQQKFTESVLRRFNMTNAKVVNTPMVTRDAERKVNESEVNHEKSGLIPYRQAIGSLLYLSNGTRPDITYAVNILSRKQSSFEEKDWRQVKRVLRYLKGTGTHGILFKGERDDLRCYPDASLGLNDEKGQSTSGYAIYLFGDVVSWRTKKQNHVALSSAEAEFVAMRLASREVTNLMEMCKRIAIVKVSAAIYEDNKAAIELAKTEESKTLKHLVNLSYHHGRSEVQSGRVNLQWISTQNQVGDFFTKALPYAKFCEFRDMLMSNCL